MPDEPSEFDVAKFRPSFFAELGHAGRVGRVLAALLLTVVGLALPLPYIGWLYSTILFVPAAVLLFFAARGKRHRRLFWFAVPTFLGLALSGVSCMASNKHLGTLGDVIAWTFATTFAAFLFGSPRIVGWKNYG